MKKRSLKLEFEYQLTPSLFIYKHGIYEHELHCTSMAVHQFATAEPQKSPTSYLSFKKKIKVQHPCINVNRFKRFPFMQGWALD